MVAKVPDLNLGKKIKQLALQLRGLELVASILYLFPLPEETYIAMQCKDFCLYYQKIVAKKTVSLYSNIFINTINAKHFTGLINL